MLWLKSPRKYLIFFLAFLQDQYQEISIRNLYRNFYFPGYPKKKESLYSLVCRLTKTKELKKIERNGESFIKINKLGGGVFDELISLQKLSKKNWDGYWRVVIFDIKEIDRNTRERLRKKLKNLGFAMWQRSVYVSPHPIIKKIDQFLKLNKIYPNAVCLEAKRIGGKNEKKFAWWLYKLTDLNQSYDKLNKSLDQILKDLNLTNRKFTDISNRIERVIDNYKNLIFNDPYLPKNLLIKNFPRRKIIEKILLILKKLTRMNKNIDNLNTDRRIKNQGY